MAPTVAILSLVFTGAPEPVPLSTACAVEQQVRFPVLFRLEQPRGASLAELQKHLPKRQWTCRKKGWVWTEMSRRDAELLLGAHAKFGCTAGAGNRVNATAYFARVVPTGWVPKKLRSIVGRIEIDDDPKFHVGDDPNEIDCATVK